MRSATAPYAHSGLSAVVISLGHLTPGTSGSFEIGRGWGGGESGWKEPGSNGCPGCANSGMLLCTSLYVVEFILSPSSTNVSLTCLIRLFVLSLRSSRAETMVCAVSRSDVVDKLTVVTRLEAPPTI